MDHWPDWEEIGSSSQSSHLVHMLLFADPQPFVPVCLLCSRRHFSNSRLIPCSIPIFYGLLLPPPFQNSAYCHWGITQKITHFSVEAAFSEWEQLTTQTSDDWGSSMGTVAHGAGMWQAMACISKMLPILVIQSSAGFCLVTIIVSMHMEPLEMTS